MALRNFRNTDKEYVSYIKERSKVRTFTPRSIGSLLIMSTNGGFARGVPVVNKSPSIGTPYTLVASQRLWTKKQK